MPCFDFLSIYLLTLLTVVGNIYDLTAIIPTNHASTRIPSDVKRVILTLVNRFNFSLDSHPRNVFDL